MEPAPSWKVTTDANVSLGTKARIVRWHDTHLKTFCLYRFNFQIDIDECEIHQCQNNATCLDLSITDFDSSNSLPYYCECEDGYQGIESGIAYKLYLITMELFKGNTVKKTSMIVRIMDVKMGVNVLTDLELSHAFVLLVSCKLLRNDIIFECIELTFWRGRLCEDEVDDCASQPCHDGSTCVDGISTTLNWWSNVNHNLY